MWGKPDRRGPGGGVTQQLAGVARIDGRHRGRIIQALNHHFEVFRVEGAEISVLDAKAPSVDQKHAKREVAGCNPPGEDHGSDTGVEQCLGNEAVLDRRMRSVKHPRGQRIVEELQFALLGYYDLAAIGFGGAFQCHVRCHDALPESVAAFDKLSSRRSEMTTGNLLSPDGAPAKSRLHSPR